jgi:TM2 domain-containing membrane protein YozV
MINFYLILGLVFVHWESMITYLKAIPITRSEAMIACGIFYLSGLIFWIINALQAHHQASKTGTGAFEGVKNPILPLFCSLLVPGWGQVLNGQPKKGGFFLIFALAGFFAFSVLLFIPMIWSSLETFSDRFLLEWILVIALALCPPVFMMWLLGIYDALKVSLDPIKKEPFRKRIKYAINRLRIKGWARGILPQAKMTLMLALFLTLSATLGYYYFPQKNYMVMLQSLQTRLYHQKMILLPYIIDQFLQVAFPQKLRR